jgi:transposase
MNKKVKEDKKWDELKGCITNTQLTANKIVENYRYLWQTEKAFRIIKTNLRIRPIYHYRKKRIEAHICISLERLFDKYKAGFSPKRAAELTHNMYKLEYILPHSKKYKETVLKMDDEQNIT